MSYDFSLNKDKPVKIERKVIVNRRNNSVSKVEFERKNDTTLINPNQSQLSHTINVPLDNISVNSKQIKQSLYNLTKSRVTVLNTPNVLQSDRNKSRFPKSNLNAQNNSIRSKTLSNYKSKSRLNYTNTTKENAKTNKNNFSGINTQPARVNKTHYYSQNKDRKADMIITDKSIEIKSIKRNKKRNILLNNKLCSKINNKNKNEISIETCDYYSNNIERGGSGSKTQRSSRSVSNKKSSESNSKVNSKIPSFIFPNQHHNYFSCNKKCNSNNDPVKKIMTQYIDLTRSDEHRLSPRNDEMIKLIKLSLDDNLKLMFNFSYEQFLSKESETLSKKSQEANELSVEIDNHTSLSKKKSKGMMVDSFN